MQHFYIGVDGGATKCIVRLEDATGKIIGREQSGPASIRLSVEKTWHSINTALDKLLPRLGTTYQLHAGMGLAGCEITEAYTAFLAHAHRFTTLIVTSDAQTACLAAHQGKDGAIIIAGTGVVGLQMENGRIAKVSGYGFPHDDEGGGAWLGLKAVQWTWQWLDKRRPASGLTTAVFAHFAHDQNRMQQWANVADATAFAELAPLVIQQAQNGDMLARHLLTQAARALDSVHAALVAAQINPNARLPCALVGGIAPFLLPLLGNSLQSCLSPCLSPPDQGAILLVRNAIAKEAIHE